MIAARRSNTAINNAPEFLWNPGAVICFGLSVGYAIRLRMTASQSA